MWFSLYHFISSVMEKPIDAFKYRLLVKEREPKQLVLGSLSVSFNQSLCSNLCQGVFGKMMKKSEVPWA